MSNKKVILPALFLLCFSFPLAAQSIVKPNYALKSHETLEIQKIETNSNSTSVYLTIENKIEGGYFCADKDIYIVYSDGSRSRLISSSDIPVCPDTYKFKTIGEKLGFVLVFPQLKNDVPCFDIIEDCKDNCFSFYGIITDSNLNKKIDNAFSLIEKKEPVNALDTFIKIAEEEQNKGNTIAGLLYINIIKLARQTGNNSVNNIWYSKLKSSRLTNLQKYISYIE